MYNSFDKNVHINQNTELEATHDMVANLFKDTEIPSKFCFKEDGYLLEDMKMLLVNIGGYHKDVIFN